MRMMQMLAFFAIFIGTIRTGVNFGGGYQFDLIMEEAQVVQD